MKYLGNTLQPEFDLPPEHHEDSSQAFRENGRFLGIASGDDLPGGKEGKGPTTVFVGEPAGPPRRKAFVIMPFTERNKERAPGFFEEVLRSLITPAGLEAGFKVDTATPQGSDVIPSTIINELLEADLVIADLRDHNPNVLFELGLRMAIDRPAVLIKAEGTGQVFVVDNMLRVFEYKPQLWRSTLGTDLPALTKHIEAGWENRSKTPSYMKILRRQEPVGAGTTAGQPR